MVFTYLRANFCYRRAHLCDLPSPALYGSQVPTLQLCQLREARCVTRVSNRVASPILRSDATALTTRQKARA